MKEAAEQNKPKSLANIQADFVLDAYAVKEMKRAAICGCRSCYNEAGQLLDWIAYPKEYCKKDRILLIDSMLDQLLNQHREQKNPTNDLF